MERKDKILTASRKLFSEKGFAATGMREIASTAGVSLGNLYNHFKNKEEIFNELLRPDQFLQYLLDIPEILQKDFPGNMDQILMAMKTLIDDNIELFRLIFIDFIEFDGSHINTIIQAMVDFGTTAFQENIANRNLVGTTLRNLDYDLSIKGFIVAVMSFFIIAKTLPAVDISRYSDQELAATISDIFRNGILKC